MPAHRLSLLLLLLGPVALQGTAQDDAGNDGSAGEEPRILTERWVLDHLEGLVDRFTGLDIRVGGIDIDLFQSSPTITIDDFVLEGVGDLPLLQVDRIRSSVVAGSLLEGEFELGAVEVLNADANLFVDADGKANWAPLLSGSPQPEPQAGPVAPSIPKIRELKLEPIDVAYENRVSGQKASFVANITGDTLPGSEPVEARLDGSVNAVDIAVSVLLHDLGRLAEKPAAFRVELDADVGGNTLAVDGRVFGEGGGLDPRIAFRSDLGAPERLLALAEQPSRPLPSASARGTIARDGPSWTVERLNAKVDRTDINGDIRVDAGTTPLSVYATLGTDTLYLDSLLNALGIETGGTSRDTTETETQKRTGSRILPDDPLPLDMATNRILGKLRYRIDAIESETVPVRSLSLAANFDPDRAAIEPLRLATAGGSVVVNGALDTSDDLPEIVAAVDLRHVSTADLLRDADLPAELSGDLGGQAKFWMTGQSVAELAGSADGGAFVVMDGGEINALLVELAGVDIAESLATLLVPGSEEVHMNCTYIDLFAEKGEIDIEDFIIDTADTIFLADGNVDLDSERLSIALEPHPKDFSLLSAPTRVAVEGSLASPSVGIGGEGLATAAAAITAAALVQGAVAILPFLAAGEAEIDDRPKHACDELGALLKESDT